MVVSVKEIEVRTYLFLSLWIGLAMLPSSAMASMPLHGTFARVHGSATAPAGYLQFCADSPRECFANDTRRERVKATPARLAELDLINRLVNSQIAPVEDIEQYGREEVWTLATTGRGDCEDYVLVKRKRLIAMGWPPSALLITVVLDENNQGHAVLTARMSLGDVVLDNKHNELVGWSDTPYTYIMRQSYLDPNSWVSLAPLTQKPGAATAGMTRR